MKREGGVAVGLIEVRRGCKLEDDIVCIAWQMRWTESDGQRPTKCTVSCDDSYDWSVECGRPIPDD